MPRLTEYRRRLLTRAYVLDGRPDCLDKFLFLAAAIRAVCARKSLVEGVHRCPVTALAKRLGRRALHVALLKGSHQSPYGLTAPYHAQPRGCLTPDPPVLARVTEDTDQIRYSHRIPQNAQATSRVTSRVARGLMR